MQAVPDIGAARTLPILDWDIAPGDFACVRMLTLHAAAGTADTHRRRVSALCLLVDDSCHAQRRGTTSPDIPGLADGVPAGAAMHRPLFTGLVG
jgi:hypothetical protein